VASAYIGTSGFSYPHWGKGVFYPSDLPQKDWFLYYTKHFDTVELNVSFYRLPRKEVFAGWRQKAGPDFVFSVKASRFITHIKRLKDCQEPVERLMESVAPLKSPKTVLLFQLPPRFKANLERLASFLQILTKNQSSGQQHWRYAFEFRDESWLQEGIIQILEKHRAAVVFQDHPDWPVAEKVTADFVYLRFHGKTSLYSSCYTERELRAWVKKIRDWTKAGRDVYAYFNNDALGYAIENARRLRTLLSQGKK